MPGIVAGIDGSHHSTRALEWALKEAALQQAQLTVLTAHSVPVSPCRCWPKPGRAAEATAT